MVARGLKLKTLYIIFFVFFWQLHDSYCYDAGERELSLLSFLLDSSIRPSTRASDVISLGTTPKRRSGRRRGAVLHRGHHHLHRRVMDLVRLTPTRNRIKIISLSRLGQWAPSHTHKKQLSLTLSLSLHRSIDRSRGRLTINATTNASSRRGAG